MLADAPDPVRQVFETVAAGAPEIRAGLPGRRVATDERNASGDEVMAADLWADELLGDRLGGVEGVGEYASEEREEVESVGEGYAVAVDPLDGSSNLRSNNPMGTVVGVYDAALPAPGRELVAAGFVLYGPITTMVVAGDGAATEYVIEAREARSASDRTSGDHREREARSASNRMSGDHREPRVGEPREVGPVELPDEPVVYGVGGRVPDWPDEFAAYVEEIERELKLRYGGAMIADVSQVLTYGGVFAYPALRSSPAGKLRLLFEGAPVGYVVEAAGGAASDGEQSLLDVEPESVHRRVPVHVGNEGLIDRLEAALG